MRTLDTHSIVNGGIPPPSEVLPFWYWLTQVVLEKRLLNGRCVVVAIRARSSLMTTVSANSVSGNSIEYVDRVTLHLVLGCAH